MARQFHFSAPVVLLVAVIGVLCFNCILFNHRQPLMAAVPTEPPFNFSAAKADRLNVTNIEPELLDYLEGPFCAGNLCRSGSWTEWLILDPQSRWEIADLQLLRTALLLTIKALDDLGLDGYRLLSGYRFRHSRGIYLPGELGILARVQHEQQEIILADGALKKQWGFYIYHELGHVVDRRLKHGLTHEFQRVTLGNQCVGSKKTAVGFWLNRFAKERPEEAAADAFALWMVLHHTTNPQPVFWMKPEEAHYETIAGAMNSALQRITTLNYECQTLPKVDCPKKSS